MLNMLCSAVQWSTPELIGHLLAIKSFRNKKHTSRVALNVKLIVTISPERQRAMVLSTFDGWELEKVANGPTTLLPADRKEINPNGVFAFATQANHHHRHHR